MIQFRKKAIVVDMDGVLFKHSILSKHVGKRATGFVKKRINPYMSDSKAKQINEVLYKNFGHSFIGLKELYDPTVTIKDYCDYVYDNDFISQMNSFEKDDIFYENALDVKRFIERIQMLHIPFYIFSNAPVEWCKMGMNMMDISIENEYILGCDAIVHGEAMALKPYKESYVHAQNHVHDTSGFPYKTQLIYIDDQMVNLQPMINNPYWKAVWYNSKKENIYTDRLYSINDINQLFLLV